MAACFFIELGYASSPLDDMLTGLIVPKLEGSGATGFAILLLGAMVMPHNIFLRSALVLISGRRYGLNHGTLCKGRISDTSWVPAENSYRWFWKKQVLDTVQLVHTTHRQQNF